MAVQLLLKPHFDQRLVGHIACVRRSFDGIQHRPGHCLSVLLAQGATVMVIRERSHPGHRLKQRAPVWRYVPVYSS